MAGPVPVVAGATPSNKMNVGFLHPGEMGSALAASARHNGHTVYWASEGRSAATARRAAAAGLVDCVSVAALAEVCDALVSIGPPHAALDIARAVAATGFAGIYIDANPIAPAPLATIQALLPRSQLVDAALIGLPPVPPQPLPAVRPPTLLLLSGEGRHEAAGVLAHAGLLVHDLGPEPGRASTLKLCHAAVHKGLLALQASAWAVAGQHGLGAALDELLLGRWASQVRLAGRSDGRRRFVAKAWRFAGEMDEVAALFAAHGVPSGAATASGEVYRRGTTPAANLDDDAYWARLGAAR